jgi:hypothetical protein
MIDDMRLAGFAERTRDVYIQAVRRLAAHYKRSPDLLSEEEVRTYLLHLRDEADPRPLPEPDRLHGALADMFDALVATLSDTRLEPDLHALLWSVVNVFHRRSSGRAMRTRQAGTEIARPRMLTTADTS